MVFIKLSLFLSIGNMGLQGGGLKFAGGVIKTMKSIA